MSSRIPKQGKDGREKTSKIPINPVMAKSRTNSLDWDSDSAKTGTVKRRPLSGADNYDVVFAEEKTTTQKLNKSHQKLGPFPQRNPSRFGQQYRPRSSGDTKSYHDGGLQKINDDSKQQTNKTGKVSDSDSGINSPLSPGSVYGVFYPRIGFVLQPRTSGIEEETISCNCEEERTQIPGERHLRRPYATGLRVPVGYELNLRRIITSLSAKNSFDLSTSAKKCKGETSKYIAFDIISGVADI
ncbi:hypothetical protein GWI33_007956 [Rhynchophorus ferrugineus]|uniref:Uncharacterized protein n=1 Tax=Rhynchophorus ferrugineus TaxID=354439 RepID=A0A834MG90_RHYFE|nr:hypothetical protein GWI33_007956 [Rhynchophorus ferrugineus]